MARNLLSIGISENLNIHNDRESIEKICTAAFCAHNKDIGKNEVRRKIRNTAKFINDMNKNFW